MKTKQTIKKLTEEDKDRLIRMGWEDRTTFEAIKEQFSLTHNQFIIFMRKHLNPNAFKLWRKRSTNYSSPLKHEKKRPFKEGRFKSKNQKNTFKS
jgi:uncharacterized protein (TIGR03643 family)